MTRHILFDLFTPQAFIGGAGEYVRRVFFALLQTIKEEKAEVTVLGLIDTRLSHKAYPDLAPDALRKLGVDVVDIRLSSLQTLVRTYNIDMIFIGAAQYWGGAISLKNITCPVVCTVHDLVDEEFATNHILDLLLLPHPAKLCRNKLYDLKRRLLGDKRGRERMKPIVSLHRSNPNCQLVAVSHYTHECLIYHFGLAPERIPVLYSPKRLPAPVLPIAEPRLQRVVENHTRYYLLMSANRPAKNAEKMLHAFRQFVETTEPEAHILTLGLTRALFPNHIVLPYLSESDLHYVIHHSYALLFPSLFEGFGYPPLEAMAESKPVLAANVTSMPEVLGDAPIYFSPLYESDIFRALREFHNGSYSLYAERAKARAETVHTRQETDLKVLIDLILGRRTCEGCS